MRCFRCWNLKRVRPVIRAYLLWYNGSTQVMFSKLGRKRSNAGHQIRRGAITAARTLLEAVCKHILDENGAAYKDTEDLPKLYGLAAVQLNLSPSQHTEQVFRQILGSCQSVVEGLGTLRNRLSDAHGKGKAAVRPAPRHAELAVNLAGSMATFLIQTLEARTQPPSSKS